MLRRAPSLLLRAGAIASAGVLLSWPASARNHSLAMLDTLQKGSWVLHEKDAGAERICLRSGRELIQLRHKQSGCGLFVVEDGADEIDVQYTCPGAGYGRTSIRRETGTLVQVQSHGIVGSAPFAVVGEARREGAC